MLLVGIYIGILAIALLSSLPTLRLDRLNYKIIALVLAVDLLTEITANILVYRFHISNVALYNVTLLLEFWLYGWYFLTILRRRWVRDFIRVYLLLLPQLWLILVIFVFHINTWNSLFFVIGSLFTVFFAALYYQQLFTAEELVKLSTSFEFWIATAVIILYACNFTYMGMLNLLTANYRHLAKQLLTVLQILNIVYYSIFTYAFLCVIPIRKSS